MEIIERTSLIIKELLKDHKNYFELITGYEKKEGFSAQDKTKMIQLVGAFLRNYYFISCIEKFVFDSKNIDVLIRVGLYYVNNAYVKAVSEEEAYESLNKFLNSIGKDLSSIQTTVLNDICKQKRQYYFSNLTKGSFKYFSVKFNLPEWFIKMMVKHYGKDVGLQTCREISKMPNQYAIINQFKVLSDEANKHLSDFKDLGDGVYEYNEKVSLRKNYLIKEKYFFQIQLGFADFLKQLPALDHSELTIYLGSKNNMYFSLLGKYAKDGNNISIITKHLYENYDLLTKIKEYRIKGVHFYEAEESGLDPLISKPQDLLVYSPKSSELEKLRIEPDYSLFFDVNSLDSIIENELKGLENVSKFVKEDGLLIYYVKTLGKKETSQLIEEFLNKHPEFELTNEKQYFPYERENSVLYYACLRKKAND